MANIDKPTDTPTQANEGEGNSTAARTYNRKARRFAKSGKVETQARDAQKAVDGPEGVELARAEAVGKSHSAGEDGPELTAPKPQVKR